MKVAWIDCETTGLDPQKNGIPITAHDAAADIEATRQIAEKIRENFGKGEKV